MADNEFTYKGKKIAIVGDHHSTVVAVDGRKFPCHHHHEKPDGMLAMWMCDEAYFASPDIRELARHFADYGYLFDNPGRVRVDANGEVVAPAASNPAAGARRKAPAKKQGGQR